MDLRIKYIMRKADTEKSHPINNERRDFINLLTTATGVVGAGAFAWTVVDSMNPSADVLALASTEVFLGDLQEGQSITIKWRGKPIFVRYRTQEEIDKALTDNNSSLIDPEKDEVRASNPKYLVLVGICTHLGCVPLGQASGAFKGDYGGWFCPCHGSHYDTSGRIRKGPAPKNMAVPPYEFISDDVIKIG